jgi:ferrochelatase
VPQPFDAVLLIAFGGPQGMQDIRPFLANVLRGRRVAPERIEEVAHHYELFGGVSPLTELTTRQAAGLQQRLEAAGVPLPVFVAMRNWHPFLSDTLAEMSRAGIRRAVGFIAAAHRSYSGCTQYRENVNAARADLARRGLADVQVTYVPDWHAHPEFVAANSHNAWLALERLPAPLRGSAELIFTAHSIPVSMAGRYPYQAQFEETAALVARRLAAADLVRQAWGRSYAVLADEAPGADAAADAIPGGCGATCVYQSRSGRPEDPWLGPDICEYLREQRAKGLEAAVVCPIGFLCDHVEVLYDLDVEAAAVCREIGLTMERAAAVNDHPRFIDMMADVVLQVCRTYEHGRPLEIVPDPEHGRS